MEKKEIRIIDTSKAFALRIVKLYKHLTLEKQEYILSKQMVRSGTSIGANQSIYSDNKIIVATLVKIIKTTKSK